MNANGIELLLRERIGLDSATLGSSVLPRAVAARMAVRKLADLEPYSHLLANDPTEWANLVGELLVAETWFFRGGRALFDRLAMAVRDAAEAGSPSTPVRIASIPCSTGEEPYSLAIALEELGVPRRQYQLDAIDLSEQHLLRARAGAYSSFAFREPLPDLLPRWFVLRAENSWELLPHVRGAVRFRCGNLVDRDFLAGEPRYDLILCRNLFIYLTPEARTLALANLDRLLAPDGRLCLTTTEADRLPSARYVPDGHTAFAIYRKVAAGTGGPGSGSFPAGPRSDRIPIPDARAAGPSSGRIPVQPASGRIKPPAPRPDSGRIPVTEVAKPTIASPQREEVPVPAAPLDPRALADAGRIEDALAACDRLLKAQPLSADMHSLLGVIRLAAGKRREAAAAFRSALYLVPEHSEALSYSIVLHEHFGETEQAAALRRRLARIEGKETT